MSPRRLRLPRFLVFPLIALFLLGTLAPFPASSARTARIEFQPMAHPIRPVHGARPTVGVPPPSYQECLLIYGIPCYDPDQMRTAYNETPLLNQGFDGRGQTIVVVDSYGSPTIQSDLATFDSSFGLPAPPSFQIIAPLGSVPFNPNDSTMVNWAYETTLDVEWAHAMAPGANIVLLTSPTAETEGAVGMPQFISIEQYALDHNLGQVISQSWGATEQTLDYPAGQEVINHFEVLYREAAAKGVTVFASAGDSGTANVGLDQTTIYPFPTVIYPASSEWVTAVGGTTLKIPPSGTYQSEVTWNDNPIFGIPYATGGGRSSLFAEPSWQLGLPASDQSLLRGARGIPDIAYNADIASGVLIYETFDPAGAGWLPIGGTSAGSPQWAALTAVADQMAGHSLGYLNPTLYQLGQGPRAAADFHDITVGNNANEGVRGYPATAGWDATTGWGSPNAANLLHDLTTPE